MKSLFRFGQHQLVFLNGAGLLFAAGIAGADHCGLVSLRLLAVLGGLSVFLLALSGVCACRSSAYFFLPVLGLFFLLGFLRYEGALGEPDYGLLAGREVQIEGVVDESPELGTVNGRQRRRYVVLVEEKGKRQGGKIYVSEILRTAGREFAPLEIGDRVKAVGKLRAIHGYGNPGRIDVVRQAKAKGISGRLTAVKVEISRTEEGNLSLWLRLRRQMEKLREHYRQGLEEAMAPRDRAAVMAMLFGGYSDLDPGLVESFTLTGIVHILSVSGSHMALLAVIVLWFGDRLGLGRKSRLAVLAAVVLLYSLLTGLVPPVVRSGLMAIAAFGAAAWGRGDSREGGRLLIIVAVALLVYQPRWLYDVSFQLSFLATAGMIYLAPGVTELLTAKGLPWWLTLGLAVTFGANVATLPIIGWYFNQFSVSSFIANLLVVPLVEFIIGSALLGGMAGLLLPPLMKLAFVGAGLVMGLVRELTSFLAMVPGGNVYLPAFSALQIVSFYIFLGVLGWDQGREYFGEIFRRGRESIGERFFPKIIGASAGLLLAGGLIWLLQPEKNITSVHFLDVGQGNASLVVTPRGRAFLIDAGGTLDGGFDVGARVVVPYLKHYGVRPGDLTHIFLSHAHADHAGGAGAVWRWQGREEKARLLTAGEGKEAYEAALFLSGREKAMIDMTAAEAGAVFDIDGVKVESLWVPAPGRAASSKGGNEYSMVVKVTAGKVNFLFTGDLPGTGEAELLREYRAGNKAFSLKAAVLQVPHHGSNSSATGEFLQAVDPVAAVVSAGFQNSFGHPHKAVLERLNRRGCQVFRTDLEGAVVFHTDGSRLTVETFND